MLSLLLAAPQGAQAKRMKTPAKKFLAQQQKLAKGFTSGEKKVLQNIASKRRELKACPILRNLPNDSYQRIIAFLYVLIDMAEETTEPWHDDFEAAARAYRKPSYGDGTLNRAGRKRGRYMKALTKLRPLDSCALLDDWAAAGWPTDWKPTGEVWEAARRIYDPDIQAPDEYDLLARLRKLGAGAKHRSRTKRFGLENRAYDRIDKVLRELFPTVDIEWR